MKAKSQTPHLSDFIAQCENKIRQGDGGEWIDELRKLNTARISRDDRLPLANICRRMGLIEQGLRILSPIVRNKDKVKIDPASDGEKGEYGVLLMKNGSTDEAIRLLKEVKSGDTYIDLQLAFCHIIRWEPSQAIPLLRRYIASRSADYPALIGGINLAASLFSLGQFDEALAMVENGLEQTIQGGYQRLQANHLEQRARLWIARGDFSRAREDLESARKILSTDAGTDLILIHRGVAILDSLSTRDATPLLKFKELARRRRHWDSLREVDLFLLKVEYDRELHGRLYFGSPYADFRNRIAREIGMDLDQASYVFGSSQMNVFDLKTGQMEASNDRQPFQGGGKNHRLLEVLLRDLYRPVSLGGIFTALFADEYFDIVSSPARVYQVLLRTRADIKKADWPVKIKEVDGGYRVETNGEFGFRIWRDPLLIDADHADWSRAVSRLAAGHSFVAQDIMDILGVSRSRALSLLRWAVSRSLVEKTGINKSTRYLLKA